ncbi:MAG: hypothetical protein H6814_00170 [Phycisphaeraceae bacterium]|nr:hypothetical protein [Phycisphaeraceae bacterium]
MRAPPRTTRLACVALLAIAPLRALAQPLPGDDAIAKLDRAEALIAQQDAAGRGAGAILGVLTEADRAALTTAITEAAELTDAASVAIDAAIAELDAAPEQDERTTDRRFALAIERRELRLPLARARAATILAALQDDPRTRTALATTAINALHKVTLRGVAIDTRGSIIAGEALLLLGEPGKALDSFNAAISRSAEATPADIPGVMDTAEARLGRVVALAQTEGDHAARLALSDCRAKTPFESGGALLALLLADTSVHLDLLAGVRPCSIAGYLGALEAETEESVYLPLREAISARIGALWRVDAWTPASAPPLALAQHALTLAAEEPTRSTAVRTLERLLDRSDELTPTELAEARLALAMVDRDDNPRRAVLLLLEIAAGDSPLAPTALRNAYAIGKTPRHTDLADPLTALFDRTLAMMIERAATDEERQDLWLRRAALFESVGDAPRLIAAYDAIPAGAPKKASARRLALSLATTLLLKSPSADGAQALLTRADAVLAGSADRTDSFTAMSARLLALVELGRFDEAAGTAEAMPQVTPGAEALAAVVIDRSLAPLTARIFDGELRGDAGASRTAAEQLRRILDSPRAQSLEPSIPRQRAMALALLYAGQPAPALAVYDRLSGDGVGVDTWRAEALTALGRADEAFAIYRRAAEGFEASGATGEPDFWRCWSGMLEILSSRGADGAQRERILVQINRLALIDPQFGGEPFRSRIERIRRAMKPTGQ